MANPSIRGHQGAFKLYRDGAEIRLDAVTRVSISMDSNFSRQNYVGNPIPEGDQTVEGWSGTIEMQVKDPFVDDFIDALIAANLAGVNVSDYVFLSQENYSDGSSRTYAYRDCQFRLSKDQGGLAEKTMKRLDMQASQRLRI